MRLLAPIVALTCAGSALAQPAKLKVIVDQDARGPCSTDQQSILMFVQSPDVQVLGITVVSGDLWMDQEVLHTLRALEIAGRTDVPVYRGAVFPLINSKEETERWEAAYGKHLYKGAWNEGMPGPFDRLPLPEGEPTTRPAPGHAANFIVEAVNAHPGEVILWCGGPLTNVALALMLDPALPEKTRELVMMGGGIDRALYRREFNWWWDPEAARMVLRAPWKKVTITPVDISVKTRHDEALVARIARAGTPLARYLEKFHRKQPPTDDPDWVPWIFMWDEVSAASVLDPSIITRSRQMYVDVDIDHGLNYGNTLAWELNQAQPLGVPRATVQFDLDLARFYELYLRLMTGVVSSPR
ncbi:MAG: nucleoside hydrolase [Acidobacteria bacterium]|nr:nucleoside hydrolase [Acidobacteriota bacterium]